MFNNYAAHAGILSNNLILNKFWDFTNPAGKLLTNFKVIYNGGPTVTVNWGDNTSEEDLTSNTPVSHTFQ
jgi:hypothetical protein